MKKVSLLVINFNGEKHLKELLESIKKQSYGNIETIVWDNKSKDNSVEIAKSFSGVKVIASEKNLGYAGGTNKAIDASSGTYVIVLNNDLVLDKDFVKKAVEAIESNKNVGIVCSRELFYNWFPKKPPIKNIGKLTFFGTVVKKKFLNKRINFILGCAFLFPKNLLKKINYCFDERFFMYFEDTDLGFRIIAKNMKIIFEPGSVYWHKCGASNAPLRLYYLTRNRLLCYYKLFSLHTFVKFLPLFLIKDFFLLTVDLKFNFYAISSVLKGYIDAFKMRKKFRNEKLNAIEQKRIIKAFDTPFCETAKGWKKVFYNIFAAITTFYFKIMFW